LQQAFVNKIGDIIVRLANIYDIDEIISLNLETLPEHYSNSFFIELLMDSPETFLVAEHDKTIIGYIMCRIEYGFSSLKKIKLSRKGHIVSFAVKKEYRNRTIGKTLVKQALIGMKSKKCSEAYLEVRVNNLAAINLYQSIDFTITTTLEKYYRDGQNALLMSKDINETQEKL
jgi:ribosomal-protein-alanine N-acetyltransferase|tara:strand:+ start:586 stop:1104 length:519 start_codon:yes stop_codon:yes gene_type:complete